MSLKFFDTESGPQEKNGWETLVKRSYQEGGPTGTDDDWESG